MRNSSETFVALTAHGANGECESEQGKRHCEKVTFPTFQVWAKPQPHSSAAVFIVNLSDKNNTETITVSLTELGFPSEVTKVNATDVWTQEEIAMSGAVDGEIGEVVIAANTLRPHSSIFW